MRISQSRMVVNEQAPTLLNVTNATLMRLRHADASILPSLCRAFCTFPAIFSFSFASCAIGGARLCISPSRPEQRRRARRRDARPAPAPRSARWRLAGVRRAAFAALALALALALGAGMVVGGVRRAQGSSRKLLPSRRARSPGDAMAAGA